MYIEYWLENGMPNTFGSSDSDGNVASDTLDCPTINDVVNVSGLVLVRLDGPTPEA